MSGEYVEVTVGPYKFSPVRYETIDVGPVTVRLALEPTDDEAECLAKAHAIAMKQLRAAYRVELDAFLEMSREAHAAARG